MEACNMSCEPKSYSKYLVIFVDILGSKNRDNFEEAYYGLLAEVLEGNISEERIDESLLRIYKVKYADMLVE